MPQIYEFAARHADGIRHADLDAGVRVVKKSVLPMPAELRGLRARDAALGNAVEGAGEGHLRRSGGATVSPFADW
jgi:hypothetical protein